MESEFKSFENQWNEALKDASVPPPDLVWDNIEKELDQKKKKRVAFLWWKNPALLSGIAAALVLSLTVLFINSKNQPKVVSQVIENKDIVGESRQTGTSKIVNKDEEKVSEVINTPLEEEKEGHLAALTLNRNEKIELTKKKFKLFGKNIKSDKTFSEDANISRRGVLSNEFINPAKPLEKEMFLVVNEVKAQEINKLKQREFKNFANRFQPFRSHISVDFEDAIVETKSTKNKLWFGVNSGVAPFNPNFETSGFTGEALASARNDAAFGSKSTEQSLSPSSPVSTSNSANYLPNGVPESSFKNGTALNFGFSFGKKLKKRLGIESGLRYLQASAFLSTNVYAINENSGTVNSFFHSNYLDSKSESTQTVLSVNTTNKQLYSYFNVPVLLNYSLPIVKHLSIEALGGVSGDLFVLGKSDAGNPDVSSLTAANSTFNLLNISGMGGLRLSYDINKSWEANMGSTYQQALVSGVSSEQNLSFKPRTFGINYGLRFKVK